MALDNTRYAPPLTWKFAECGSNSRKKVYPADRYRELEPLQNVLLEDFNKTSTPHDLYFHLSGDDCDAEIPAHRLMTEWHPEAESFQSTSVSGGAIRMTAHQSVTRDRVFMVHFRESTPSAADMTVQQPNVAARPPEKPKACSTDELAAIEQFFPAYLERERARQLVEAADESGEAAGVGHGGYGTPVSVDAPAAKVNTPGRKRSRTSQVATEHLYGSQNAITESPRPKRARTFTDKAKALQVQQPSKSQTANIKLIFIECAGGVFGGEPWQSNTLTMSTSSRWEDVYSHIGAHVNSTVQGIGFLEQLRTNEHLDVKYICRPGIGRPGGGIVPVAISAMSTLNEFIDSHDELSEPYNLACHVHIYLQRGEKLFYPKMPPKPTAVVKTRVPRPEERNDDDSEDEGTEEDLRPEEYCYVRLGSTGQPSGNPNNCNEVPLDWALVAEVNTATKEIALLQVHTWDFGTFCVADFDMTYPVMFRKHGSDDYRYLPRYQSAKSERRLREMILDAEDDMPPEGGRATVQIHSEDPDDLNATIPLFDIPESDVAFDPSLLVDFAPPDGKTAKGSIDAVVHFIDRVSPAGRARQARGEGILATADDGDNGSKSPPVRPDDNAQYEFKAQEPANAIAAFLHSRLQQWNRSASLAKQPDGKRRGPGRPRKHPVPVSDNDDDEDVWNTTALYQAPLKGTWDLELWVLPQQPAPEKLFRYPSGRDGSAGVLSEFVKYGVGGRAVDTHLYLQARIVLKQK